MVRGCSLLLLMFCTLISGTASVALAQNGDRGNEKQPETWRDFDVPPAPVVPAEEAVRQLVVAPGFRVELVASEPLVEDPVAIAFDPAGRIWAVEMRGYMPNVDGEGEDQPVGRVVVLEDTNGDRFMDRSTVFLEKLVQPRAIAVVEGGVLIAEPTNLWFCRDTDGDLQCDQRTAVAKYGSNHPDQLEHTENGLLWGLDNWIYNAKSKRRFRWADGKISEEPTLFRGQWGIAQDDEGRLYYNGNSSWLFGDDVPARYLLRNPHAGKAVGQPHPIGRRVQRDESVHTIRVNPGINRGYQKHMLRKDGRLARTTSVSGLTIYRGDQFPDEYLGDAFVPEPAGNALGHFRLSRDADGFAEPSEHVLYPDDRWQQREFLASPDERFRPVDCTTGTDGALYVVDMYRGILQHRMYVTTFLRKQILERGLDKPVGLGRIYRIVHEGGAKTRPVRLDGAALDLVAKLAHGNGEVRTMAQRRLVELRDAKTIEPLRKLARSSSLPLARIHALWTLHGMGALDFATTKSNLGHANASVRVHAVRTGERWIGHTDHHADYLLALMELAAGADRRVRIQLMYSLGSFPPSDADANDVRLELLTAHADDAQLRTAAASGWRARALGAIGQLCALEEWTEASAGRSAMLTELAHAALRHRETDLRALLLRVTFDPVEWRRIALLDGVLARAASAKRKLQLDTPVTLTDAPNPELQARIERVRESLTAKPRTAVKWTAEEVALHRHGAKVYETCATCHGEFGEGVPGLAPQLADSPWVVGDADPLVLMLLHGLQGPIEVAGQLWNDTMPPITLDEEISDDRSIAGVLSYIRNEWGHRADFVTEEQVEEVRAAHQSRTEPWTVKELEARK